MSANMTYAILKHGGHQYRVSAGDRLLVDRLTAEVGSTVTLEPVLFVANGAAADVGAGAVPDARVIARVVAHRRGRKLRVFTYKPKKRSRRTLGHRSQLTELRIVEVAAGEPKPARATAAKRAPAPDAAPPASRAKPVSAPAATQPRTSSAKRATSPRTKKTSDGA